MSSPEGKKKSQRFDVHVTRGAGPRGSKLWSLIVVAVLLGIGGTVFYFFKQDGRLVEHLRARDNVAVAAAYAFYYRGAPPAEAYEHLLAASTQGTPSLRRASILALGAYKSREPVAHLSELLVKGSSPEVRAAAARALGENGNIDNPNVDDALLKAFSDDDERVREEAARAAGVLRFDHLIPGLIAMLSESNRVGQAAKQSLDMYTPGDESYGMNRAAWSEWYEGRR